MEYLQLFVVQCMNVNFWHNTFTVPMINFHKILNINIP